MDHIQFMVDRASEMDVVCGHALMVSCPPEPHLENHPDVKFGLTTYLNGNAPKTWDLSKGDLANLLDLSKRLNLDGEITPVSKYIHWISTKPRGIRESFLTLVGYPFSKSANKALVAWGMLLGNSRFSELGVEDFEKISQDLSTKVRCYG